MEGFLGNTGSCIRAAARQVAALRGKVSVALLALLLGLGDRLALRVYGQEGAAQIQDAMDVIATMIPWLGAAMIAFGAVKIGQGVYSDSADDKQKGVMACIGGAIVVAGGAAFNAITTGP